MEYLLQYNQNKHSSLHLEIISVNGLPLCNLKVSDLIFYKDEPIYRGCGVYVFKLNNEIVYVGSCVSRSFVERIPAHFDIREVGWFNSLLKSILKSKNQDLNEITLLEAANFAMSNMNLVLINFTEPHAREAITRLELELIQIFKTKNRRPSLKRFNL